MRDDGWMQGLSTDNTWVSVAAEGLADAAAEG